MVPDVAYQLGLPVDGRYVSGCLTDFQIYIQGGRPAWVWFQELLGVIPPPSQVQKFAVNCTWFQETFGECPEGADKETVWRFARAYIMIWLPYIARLEEMGTYSWGLQHWHGCTGACAEWRTDMWWSGYNPSGSEKGPRVQMWRLRIDMVQARDFIWMPYSYPEVLQVVHSEALKPWHTAMWWSVTSLIYFAVIEWHQIDRVLPQFGGVQPRPQPALNINFLMSKDGRDGDRWFPSALQFWHLHWESRADHVLWFDVVADPKPSHDFLE
ncbi:serine/threonine-protein phosphatase 7 long form homolog [Arachis hypogaea]|uniref:serine/threonine-protein phosphatase 7 long form homolog n=1 Tax=Arachis hypogaea TaxID=3818 RepID=UPI003B219853